MLVLVTGATGFLGRRVVWELLGRGHQVRALAHSRPRQDLFPEGSVDWIQGSVSDTNTLALACHRADAVVHLVAIIRQRKGATFDQVNRQGAANLAAAAKASGTVGKLVHVSVIGAADAAASAYLRSKWQGEQAVVSSGLPYTILRPSLIFGEGDEFLNSLAGVVRIFPVVPVVGSGRNLFQPIAAEDVAQCAALALERDDLNGQTVEIGGPQQVTYAQLLRLIARTLGQRRLYARVPVWLMRLNVAVLEKVQPRPPVTSEQLRLLPVRNVAEPDSVERVFGFTPRSMEGNIGYIRSVSFGDGLKIALGFMPARIRDH
ncbi:MAG: NAD-dependent epimerase/dehydratase family protein [SAR202 cluster bacterium]|nr:NAD-dependent epimerase/dehydratase family protein [SAR202 cluster bacterium]